VLPLLSLLIALLTDVAECGTATVPLGYGVLVDPYPDQSPCVVTVDVARGEQERKRPEKETREQRKKDEENKEKCLLLQSAISCETNTAVGEPINTKTGFFFLFFFFFCFLLTLSSLRS
jgi:hypothetical protein